MSPDLALPISAKSRRWAGLQTGFPAGGLTIFSAASEAMNARKEERPPLLSMRGLPG
jgi:hypothetical protein